MAPFFSFSLITLLVVVVSLLKGPLVIVEGYRPQEIILFTGRNFTGKQKSFYESQIDLKTDSVGRVAKSHCVVRGLWRVSGSFLNSSAMFIENVFGDEKSGKVCGSWETIKEYKDILLIGSQDLDTAAIQFHSRPRFYGNTSLYFDGRVLRLPSPLNFSSFGFTGKHNWTIFRGTMLEGHSECLVANTDHFGGHVVTFNTNRSIMVGSIWRGCGSLVGVDPKVLGRKAEFLENSAQRAIIFGGINVALFSFLLAGM